MQPLWCQDPATVGSIRSVVSMVLLHADCPSLHNGSIAVHVGADCSTCRCLGLSNRFMDSSPTRSLSVARGAPREWQLPEPELTGRLLCSYIIAGMLLSMTTWLLLGTVVNTLGEFAICCFLNNFGNAFANVSEIHNCLHRRLPHQQVAQWVLCRYAWRQ